MADRRSLPPSGNPPPGSPPTRTWLLLGLLLLLFVGVRYLAGAQAQDAPIAYSTFFRLVSEDRVESVTLSGQDVSGALKSQQQVDGRSVKQFRTMTPPQDDPELLPLLRKKGVTVRVESVEQPLGPTLIYYGMLTLLLVGGWYWLRRAQKMVGTGGPLSGLIKGRTRRFEKEAQVGVDFDDVAGLRAAKQDLEEIVDFLKEPDRYRRLGGKVPRGVLLVGPPGTGKTLLARAVAGEAGVPFFSINGSEFIELFVGVGASRVRELFDEAKKVAPAIIFIDEIDAVGRSRGTGMGGGHDEREQTLNQLLSEMDGFSRNDLTIVIAATNRPDVLDQALLRPGRFDRRVIIDRPELAARQAILQVHTKDKPLASNVNLQTIASSTPGFSGADLANLVNEAVLNATRRGANAIERQDFRSAYDKIVLGDLRETRLDPEEKRRVAAHEAGHAIVAHFSDHAEPLQRVTIIPRGMALGVTQQTPATERHVMTRPELETRLRMMMGGYAAEKVVIGDTSSGAANDFKQATELAFKMVAQFGMSERVGPMYIEHRTEHPFLGHSIATEGGVSDATVHDVEQEARRILVAASEQAQELIVARRPEVDRLIEALLDHESIECDELHDLLGSPVSERCVPLA